MYSFFYRISEEDYFEFNKHVLFGSKRFKPMLLLTKIILPVILALMLVFSIIMGEKSVGVIIAEAVIYTAIAVLWVLFFEKIYLIPLKRLLKKMKNDGKLPYSTSGTLLFDEDNFTDKSILQTLTVDYAAVEKIDVNKGYVYIFNTSQTGFILPESSFDSEDQRSGFLKFLEDKTGKTPTVYS